MRKTIRLIILGLTILVAGSFMLTDDTSAYWSESNGKQCFAVQYQNSYVNTGRAAEDGNTDNARGEAYSTRIICAKVDSNGKVTSLEDNNGYPANSTPITDDLGLKIYVDGNSVKTKYCTATGKACENGKAVVTGTYELSRYSSFRALAQAVVNSAPMTYNGGDKRGLDDNITKETAKETAQEEYNESQAMNNGSYVTPESSVCYDESGHLGWIFCPLIEGISNAMESLYDNIVEPFLVIDPGLISGSGTYMAWDVFRNFANIAFVILFLVVIFSQLTGVGIDNYGIKRMLPKLIVTAVLINLSYVICQLAVDLSNILGNGLQSLFSGIASQINNEATSPINFFSNTQKGLMTFLAGGAGGAVLGVEIAPLVAVGGFALIIPILLGLLSAIVSVLFMFAILFVRKAMAILLVAVAPVAFVAYILPNTKRLIFDKWLNIFKGVLTVYPLAGALVGGGMLASAIIIAAAGDQAAAGNDGMGTFFLFLGAMLLQVVPFFFLPRLFRSSLRAVGNLGERIANRGARFSERARGAVEGSERIQKWSEDQRRNARFGRGQRTIERLGSMSSSDMNKYNRRRRLLAAQRDVSAYNAQEVKDFSDLYSGMSREQIMADAGYDAQTGQWGTVAWANDRNADQRMSALISAMESKGMENDMFSMLEHNGAGAMARQTLAGSNNKVARAFGKNVTGETNYRNFMANGGMKNYVDKKGADFLDGLDDKALAQIRTYSNNSNNQIMSNDLIHEGQARINSQDAVDQLDQMMVGQGVGNISGEQLARWNSSSTNELFKLADSGDAAALNAILRASDAIANDVNLPSKMDNQSKDRINNIRVRYNRAPIP